MPDVVASAAIGAAGSIVGGLINSNSSSDAADKQQYAAQQALALQKQIYDQNQKNRAPFLAASTNAVGQLGQLASQQHQMTLPAAYTGGGMRSLAQLGQPQMPPQGQPGQGATGQPIPQTPPAGPDQSQMVTVKAPNGQIGQIPASQLQMALSKGATQV